MLHELGQIAGDGAGDAGAQQGVNQNVGNAQAGAQDAEALVECGLHGEQTHLLDFGVVFVGGGVTRLEKVEGNIRPGFGQIAPGNKTIAAVVAGANQHQDAGIYYRPAGDDRFGQTAPGGFHHLGVGIALRIGRFFSGHHLGDGK